MRRTVTSAPGAMSVELDAAAPELAGDALRIKVEYVGLCGSDFSAFAGRNPYFRYPQVQGHELCGIVLELGPGYRGAISLGERVTVEPTIACGDCAACRKGRYNCCANLQVMGIHVAGGLAEEIVVASAQVHPVGDLAAELAALVEPVAIGLQAVTRAAVAAGDTVLILGAGPIGITTAVAALERGATVISADRNASRLAVATGLGVTHAIDTSSDDLGAVVARLTKDEGVDIVIEATGSPELIRESFDLVAHAGTIVIVGLSTQDVSLPIIDFTRKELTVLGSRNSTGLFPEAIELVRRHRLTIGSLITHRVPMADVQATFEALAARSVAGKVLVRVGDPAVAG